MGHGSKDPGRFSTFEITHNENGPPSVNTNGTVEDNGAALEALRLLAALRSGAGLTSAATSAITSAPSPPDQRVSTAPTLREAFERFRAAEAPEAKADTWTLLIIGKTTKKIFCCRA
ncbi:hypothetical protein [Dyella sp. 333MFSha]|uniref:hypothetical protein n=1 Tax=Dyella sp. 333MFSha TaxID=1798240 RepID=UPI000B868ADA|nr:hypothetical protein [Dyella sp. 333MFSha]